MANTTVEPKTYTGYNDKSEVVTSATANSAKDMVNPGEIESALSNIETAMTEGISQINTAISNVAPDASEAVIIQGTKMDQTIADFQTSLKSFPNEISSSLSSLVDEAVKVHDDLQDRYNQAAYDAVKNTAGVSTVR